MAHGVEVAADDFGDVPSAAVWKAELPRTRAAFEGTFATARAAESKAVLSPVAADAVAYGSAVPDGGGAAVRAPASPIAPGAAGIPAAAVVPAGSIA